MRYLLDTSVYSQPLRNKPVHATLNTKDFSRIEGLAWEDWSC
jgi:predicted nucleic acid-binding protein